MDAELLALVPTLALENDVNQGGFGFHRWCHDRFCEFFNWVKNISIPFEEHSCNCLALVFILWCIASMALIGGVYGPHNTWIGPSSSILVKPNPFWVQSIKVLSLSGKCVTFTSYSASVLLNSWYLLNHLAYQSLSDKTRVIFLTPPPMNERQIERVFGDAMRGRSNERCRPYVEALLKLCREINVKGIDLWTAIQQQDDWLNICFTDGIHFTSKASEIVVKEVLKAVREADWKPSLYWKSLPVEFPFDVDVDVPNSISLCDLDLTRNKQLESQPGTARL